MATRERNVIVCDYLGGIDTSQGLGSAPSSFGTSMNSGGNPAPPLAGVNRATPGRTLGSSPTNHKSLASPGSHGVTDPHCRALFRWAHVGQWRTAPRANSTRPRMTDCPQPHRQSSCTSFSTGDPGDRL